MIGRVWRGWTSCENAAGCEALLRGTIIPGIEARAIGGGSAIVGPDRNDIADPGHDEPRLLFAELDPGRLSEERVTLDVTGHYHRPRLFEFKALPSSRRFAGAGE